MLKQKEETLGAAAAKAGMDEKTARKYLQLGRLPSQIKAPHTWRTRPDPFSAVWEEARVFLEVDAGLEAKTIFEELQRTYPGRFSDGQLRTLQRRVKRWRALEGPSRETFFPQVHEPGDLAEMDFTWMNELGVTIQKQRFDHLLFHFVLTYSNWETGTVRCTGCVGDVSGNLLSGSKRPAVIMTNRPSAFLGLGKWARSFLAIPFQGNRDIGTYSSELFFRFEDIGRSESSTRPAV